MKTEEILSQILCPPGNGVYTVETAKEKKEFLHTILFDNENIQEKWEASLPQRIQSKKPLLLGVPSDNGGGIQRGANWGPLYLREALLKDSFAIEDLGDVRVVPHLLDDKYLNEETIKKVRIALYGKDIDLPVSPLSIAEKTLSTILDVNPDARIFSFGGDHSVSAPLTRAYLKRDNKIGILHFDAHTDLLEERLGIDQCFATWAHSIINLLETPKQLIQVGIRRSGKDRNHWENKYGINQIWSSEFQEQSAQEIAERVIQDFRNLGTKKIYISFDIDAIDSDYASATGTPEENGLKPHEAAIIIDRVKDEFDVIAGDLVEVAPLVNHRGSHSHPSPEPESTIDVSVQLSKKIINAMEKGCGCR